MSAVARIAVGALVGLAVFLLAGRMVRRRSPGTASRDIMTLIGLLTWRPIRRVLTPNRRGLIIADRLLWSALEAGVRSPQPRLARSPYPLPLRARMYGRNCRLTVRVPAGMDVPMLAEAAPLLGAGCQAQAITVQPWPQSPLAYADIDVMYRRLQPGRRIETVEAPDAEGEIMVGLGMAGPVVWELDDEAHLGIYGPSGAGKGVLARWVALQWVDPAHGRELVIIDGQGAPEWAALADVPGVTVLQFDPAQPVESLTAIVAALDSTMLDASSVAALCAEHCVDGWRHLPDDIKRLRPRRLLMCDELTALQRQRYIVKNQRAAKALAQ